MCSTFLITNMCFCPVTPPGNPKSLTSQCRLAARRYLKKINKIHLIEQLDLPTSLKNFLQYKDAPITAL